MSGDLCLHVVYRDRFKNVSIWSFSVCDANLDTANTGVPAARYSRDKCDVTPSKKETTNYRQV
jgi:hypothetical protein